MARRAAHRILAIYVLGDCVGCGHARQVAETVRTQAPPNLEVQLVDLAAADAVRPAAVFAVPTYLLDGRVLSLGNPDEAWLLDHLARSVGCV